MNSHKNARLTFEGRKLLVERIAAMGLMPAAEAAGISPRTARKWLRRFEAHGELLALATAGNRVRDEQQAARRRGWASVHGSSGNHTCCQARRILVSGYRTRTSDQAVRAPAAARRCPVRRGCVAARPPITAMLATVAMMPDAFTPLLPGCYSIRPRERGSLVAVPPGPDCQSGQVTVISSQLPQQE